jgi:RsiW-degrading membrane proteinase PrsW (M82 family)
MTGLLVLALVPVFVLAFYIYFRDKYEKEPWQQLLKAMLAGVLIALPVSFFEGWMTWLGASFTGVLGGFWKAFFVASLTEEAFKLLIFFLLFWNHRHFNEKYDGIIYASFIALGFAGIENVLYVMHSGVSTGLARAFTAVPAHALFGVIMGFYGGLAKFYPKKRTQYLYSSFLFPFALHGLYDFILMSGINWLLLLFLPLVVFMWINGLKRMKQLNDSSIFRDDLSLGIDFSKVKDYQPVDHEDGRSDR